jgi:hypothetical protein
VVVRHLTGLGRHHERCDARDICPERERDHVEHQIHAFSERGLHHSRRLAVRQHQRFGLLHTVLDIPDGVEVIAQHAAV